MRFISKKNKKIVLLSIGILFLLVVFILLPKILEGHYIFERESSRLESNLIKTPEKIIFVPSYVTTPTPVKGVYMTSWVASNIILRNGLVKLIEDTELNTLVIDIKDYSGRIVFSIDNPELKSFGSEEIRIKDLAQFIESLHKKGVYVVGRIAVFQDAYFVKHRRDLAVKNKAGVDVWKDKKGISWIDPGSREYWDYIILLSKEAREIGFDEINFDYIRFPSDGNMQDISYPWSSTTPKHLVMREFFQYLDNNLNETGLKTSADLFGMTTTAQDDMGIVQLLEDTLPYFDYVMPMVYPSHYPTTFMGYKNPVAYPYEVVKFAMQGAVNRANIASTTSSKLR